MSDKNDRKVKEYVSSGARAGAEAGIVVSMPIIIPFSLVGAVAGLVEYAVLESWDGVSGWFKGSPIPHAPQGDPKVEDIRAVLADFNKVLEGLRDQGIVLKNQNGQEVTMPNAAPPVPPAEPEPDAGAA